MIPISNIIPTLPVFSRPEGMPDRITMPLVGRPTGEILTWDPSRGCYLSSQVQDVFLPWFIARLLYRYYYPKPVPND